jgi:hypothetical protein
MEGSRKDLTGVSEAQRIGPKRARERYHVFCDESATDSQYPCYGIGALIVPETRLLKFNEYVGRKLTEHGVVGEARWKKIDAGHGPINFAIEAWRDIVFHPSVRFAAIVVNKASYRKWTENKEEAFYVTYTFLLKHAAKLRPGDFDVVIDNRSDSYDKQGEVIEIVSNHMLRAIKSDSKITSVAKEDSKFSLGLQVVDLFTGAITHAHAMAINKGCAPNAGKQLLMARMAAVVGWKDLYCDTMPKSPMNIWHFPKEWRKTPETREVKAHAQVSFVMPEELATARQVVRRQ